MWVDGRQGETRESLELAARPSVVVLYPVVDEGERSERERKPGQADAGDEQSAGEAEHIGQQNVEYEWQRVVDAVHVGGQTVEDAATRRLVEEAQASLSCPTTTTTTTTRLHRETRE